MAQVEYIKHLYENEGKSILEISKMLNLNRRTVTKYAYQQDWNNPEKGNKQKNYPVLGEYLGTINSWLEEDLKVPRKQRHTATRVYDRLVDEFRFKGGKRTVTEYVSRKKLQLNQNSVGNLPLEHKPATAQADFGQFVYILNGEEKTGHYLTLSFPYSNTAFTQVFNGENQECLMEGLKRIFNFVGGVPTEILFDNMKTAVIVKPKGEKELIEGFRRFSLHYRFKAMFCNVEAGNEKGNVEGKIGYHRRNWFVPVPKIDDLEKFNQTLWQLAIKDLNRKHYKKGILLSELWKHDKENLLNMPQNEYNVFKILEASVDKYGYVKYDTNSYAINPEYAGKHVTLRIYFNKIEIYYEHKLLVIYNRSYKRKDEVIDWKQYVPVLCKKPGALDDVKFYDQIPEIWREHLKNIEKKERKTLLLLLSEIINANELDTGTEALKLANLYGKSDVESIRQCYYGLTHETFNPAPYNLNVQTPIINAKPELSQYDRLLKGVV